MLDGAKLIKGHAYVLCLTNQLPLGEHIVYTHRTPCRTFVFSFQLYTRLNAYSESKLKDIYVS